MSEKLTWKRVKAGTKFPGDAVVIYDHDPDPRLSRAAIYDGWYLLVEDLRNELPKQTICSQTTNSRG